MRPVYMYLRSAANARAGVSGSVISVVPGWDSFMPPYSKALPSGYHCHYSDQAAPVRTANLHRHTAEQCFCPIHRTVIQQDPADFINTRNSQAMEQGRGTLPMLCKVYHLGPTLTKS